MVLGRLDYKYPLAGRWWAVAGFLLGVAGESVFSSVCTPGLGLGINSGYALRTNLGPKLSRC